MRKPEPIARHTAGDRLLAPIPNSSSGKTALEDQKSLSGTDSAAAERGEKALAPLTTATITGVRSVAQSGSASGLGPEGRRFESSRSDHLPTGEIPCKHCRLAHRYSPSTPSPPCFSFCVIPDKAGQFPTFRGGSEVAWVARGLKATVSRLEGAIRTHGQQPIETHPNRRHPADP